MIYLSKTADALVVAHSWASMLLTGRSDHSWATPRRRLADMETARYLGRQVLAAEHRR